VGETATGGGKHLFGFMGYYPQLEVTHDIPLDQVAKILVPEHLWDKASAICQARPELRSQLQMVKGSGATEELFLSGRGNMSRRSRIFRGTPEPLFGRESFYLFEQAYFQIVLNGESQVKNTLPYFEQAQELISRHEYGLFPDQSGWLVAAPLNGAVLPRLANNDWKAFVNPTADNFFPVLGTVMEVLQFNSPFGISFKIPDSLDSIWREGRPFGQDPKAPKITLYMNEWVIGPILGKLEKCLVAKGQASAGFGPDLFPSFTNRFGETNVISYKKEYFAPSGRDLRAEIAIAVERFAIDQNWVPAEILQHKRNALSASGFYPPTFHVMKEEFDPVLKQTVK
jgi:hypothetical protein